MFQDNFTMVDQGDITELLHAAKSGKTQAGDELLVAVYDGLRQIARKRMAGERAGHTMQPTDLIHEAYLKLMPQLADREWEHRGQFFFAAAQAMRRILIDHARKRNSAKRTAPDPSSVSSVLDLAEASDPSTVLALDEALSALEAEDAELEKLVRLHFFAGLSIEEAAEILGLSRRTAFRRWQFARAWLHHHMTS